MKVRGAGLIWALVVVPASQAQGLQSSVPLDGAAFRVDGNRFNGVARGGIFTIFTNNGPAAVTSATTLPLGTALGGASIRIQVNDQTCNAPMLVASRGQATGIVCSDLPAGLGNLTYTFNGQSAPAQPVLVRDEGPTIFTQNLSGQGPGVITHADNRVVTPWEPLHPDEVFVVWFQGGGPLPKDNEPAPGDLRAERKPHLYLGDQEAVLDYYGGSGCCAGLWQLAGRVPANPTFGCFVPVALNQGDYWSNYVSAAVAPSDQPNCGDPHAFDTPSMGLLRNSAFLAFEARLGGYSTTNVPFTDLDRALTDPQGFYYITGDGYVAGDYYFAGSPNPAGSCRASAVRLTQTDAFGPTPVAIQGGSGVVLTFEDGTTQNLQTGFDSQLGGVVTPPIAASTLARVRSLTINDSQYATPLGRFNITGRLQIDRIANPPRVVRDRLRAELLEPLFRNGQPPREGAVTLALSAPVPENVLLRSAIDAVSGNVLHTVECYFRGGQSEYRIPARLFANIPDTANGMAGDVIVHLLDASKKKAPIATGVEFRYSAEDIVTINVVRQ